MKQIERPARGLRHANVLDICVLTVCDRYSAVYTVGVVVDSPSVSDRDLSPLGTDRLILLVVLCL